MGMPNDLVLIRHGESELNIAARASRKGDESLWTPEFRGRHHSEAKLTDKGRLQARAAGAWVAENIGVDFDRYYVSPYARALETAALLGLSDARWFEHHSLRERDWGDMEMMPDSERKARFEEAMARRDINALYWCPPNGESIVGLAERLYSQILGTLHRELDGKRVVIVNHGEAMWGFRFRLERMSAARWIELDESKHPYHHIHNCQVIHYTRVSPVSGQVAGHLAWMRSVWPFDLSKSDQEWHPVSLPRYSNAELLARVEQIQPFLPAAS